MYTPRVPSSHHFAVSIDETLFDFRVSGAAREIRHEHGHCWNERENDGWRIDATDDLSATIGGQRLSDLDRVWLEERLDGRSLLNDTTTASFIRVVRRRAITSRAGEIHRHEMLLLAAGSSNDVVLIVRPEELLEASKRLRQIEATPPELIVTQLQEQPWLFTGGSGAVLLHEAVGHAAESGASMERWPGWLLVADDPRTGLGAATHDDCGDPIVANDLTAGQRPSALRRRSFSDVPLHRMSNVQVVCAGSPTAIPEKRLEVEIVSGGSYDPLLDMVTLRVAVAFDVNGDRRHRVAPFSITTERTRIRQLLSGHSGTATTYPGVICSSEGASLPVGSLSPDLLFAGPLG
jgi:hypothetical protein